MVLPCHVCACDNHLSSDHPFIQVCFYSSVPFLGGCTYTLSLLWLYHFQYLFYLNAVNNDILLWLVRGWRWAFRMHEFDKAVTVVITFFPSQHQPITFHHMCKRQSCTRWCHSMQYGSLEYCLKTSVREYV